MKTKKKKSKLFPSVLALTVFGLVVAGAVHAVDNEAKVHCNFLVMQAAQYDTFFLSETEKEMCASVGVQINVRYSPEVLAGMAESADAFRAANTYTDSEKLPVPAWYIAQQHKLATDLAYLKLHPELIPICACESTGRPDATPRHFEADGVTVLTGRITPEDKGMCQINEYFWGNKAKELGYDLLNPFDNVAMANYIFELNGAQPWYPSRKCHGQG